MKKLIGYFIVFSIVLFSGCKKELLDFASDEYYNVEQFLKAKNCDTECEKAASCEGKIVKLKGTVDMDFAVKETGEFWLKDTNNDKYQLNIKVDSNIVDVVFYKLEGYKGKVVKVEGKIKGFDARTNFTCDRKFVLEVTDEEKVSGE